MEWYSQRKGCGETREMAEMETNCTSTSQHVELRFDQYHKPLLTDVTS